ncbi:MAG: DNA mismatch repair protein MutS, partial [Caulobacteraceae bacterium]|nr:DNA mismatch repair protein MutS [Caulobacteraceae bacterium]
MAQFFDMKARQPDALLFFRMGDFYELFFEDAARAAGALGIALTTRGTHLGEPIPMAGVPVHAADAYLAKLIRAGFRVAVCEQMESPEAARRRGSKSVVRRDIVRVVTPGTLTEDSLLAPGAVNRLAAVALRAGRMAVAALELSTGDVECALVAPGALAAALAGVGPSEIVVPDRLLADAGQRAAIHGCGAPVQPLPASLVDPAAAEGRVKRLYGVASLEALGALDPAEVAALALLAAHIEITQAGRAPLLKAPRRAGPDGEMTIDPATRTSLEIGQTLAGERQGSLTAAVDRTVTGPGARVLAARLARPSTDVAVIAARHDAVGWLLERRELRRSVRERLRATGDPARAMTRLALGRGGPRDLAAIRDGIFAAA